MRLISALLCLCFTFNVMASTGTVQELEKAFDNYQYEMTVEWDQKDQSFMQDKTEVFYKTLAALMQEGLTAEQVVDLASKKMKDAKAIEALKLKMSLLSTNAASSEELAKSMSENAKSFYNNGASWNGAVIITGGIVLVIAAAIAYSIWWDSKHVCVETAQGTQCGYVSYYYNGPQYWQCWETTYCSRYEDK